MVSIYVTGTLLGSKATIESIGYRDGLNFSRRTANMRAALLELVSVGGAGGVYNKKNETINTNLTGNKRTILNY